MVMKTKDVYKFMVFGCQSSIIIFIFVQYVTYVYTNFTISMCFFLTLVLVSSPLSVVSPTRSPICKS